MVSLYKKYKKAKIALFASLILFSNASLSQVYYEIDGSPDSTHDAPLHHSIKAPGEKVIIVDPNEHVWGAYNQRGILVRWGIATAGALECRDMPGSCRTKTGRFRIYSLGDASCSSTKFPFPDGGAPMPYCMYFSGGQALHGSHEVIYDNVSHGCVRLHVNDAKWLRYHFVEGPNATNHYRGTQVIIKPYDESTHDEYEYEDEDEETIE
jgi:hypothetical protein